MNKNPLIHEDECAEDLQQDGLFLIQKQQGFRFGTDAVLLSDFAARRTSHRVLDLCTGTGIVAVLLSAKLPGASLTGLEIQPEIARMATRTILLNGLETRMKIIEGNLKCCTDYFTPHSFDCVTVNPPYMRADANLKNALDTKTISRHEVLCTLEDVIRAAASMLCFHGNFFMVHRPDRLADVLSLMQRFRIEPKVLQFVHHTPKAAPSLILVEGSYCGGQELRVLPPLFLS